MDAQFLMAGIATLAIMLGVNDWWEVAHSQPTTMPFVLPAILLVLPVDFAIRQRFGNHAFQRAARVIIGFFKQIFIRHPDATPLTTIFLAVAAVICMMDDLVSAIFNIQRVSASGPPFVAAAMYAMVPVLYIVNTRRAARCRLQASLRT